MCEKNAERKKKYLHGESVNTNTRQQIANKNGSFRADIALAEFSSARFDSCRCFLTGMRIEFFFQIMLLTF